MGIAETMFILPQVLSCHSLPVKSRLVNTSTSDNEMKSTVSVLQQTNFMSNSLTELRSWRCDGKRCVVSPSADRITNSKLIYKVPSQTDMWECIRTHYQYLMEDDLIATCKKTREELSWMYYDATPSTSTDAQRWTCADFIKKFNEIHDSLHSLYTACADEEDKTCFEQVNHNTIQILWNEWKTYKEKAIILEKKYPCMKDEISKRCNILSNKWEALELCIWPKKQEQRESLSQKVLCQMKQVRKWLSEVDSKLTKVTVNQDWTSEEKLNAWNSQKALQQEIETRGGEVTSLIHQVELLGSATIADDQLTRAARNLERSWHNLWLRSLENLCVTELSLKKEKNDSKAKPLVDSSDAESDEGPRKKHRRLIYDCGPRWDNYKTIDMEPHQMPLGTKSKETDTTKRDLKTLPKTTSRSIALSTRRDVGIHCVTGCREIQTNDKCVMVGTTGITALKEKYGDDFSNFEIIQDFGYSSESSTHLSSDDVSDTARNYSYSPPRGRGDITSFALSSGLNVRKDVITSKLSEFSVAQAIGGYNSLGSSSSASHNDSGFGTADSPSVFCEAERITTTSVVDYPEVEPNDWLNGVDNCSSSSSSASCNCGIDAEVIADLDLSFPNFYDEKEKINDSLTLEHQHHTSDGFDSDESIDNYCNRSSLTSDAQLYYKMTSVDSESGDCEFADDAADLNEFSKTRKRRGVSATPPGKHESLSPVCESTDEEFEIRAMINKSRDNSIADVSDSRCFCINDQGPMPPIGTVDNKIADHPKSADRFCDEASSRPSHLSSSPIPCRIAVDQVNNSSCHQSYMYRLKHKRLVQEKSISDSGLSSLGYRCSDYRNLEDWILECGGRKIVKSRKNRRDAWYDDDGCGCPVDVNSSGDASGEYTESDGNGHGLLSSSSEEDDKFYRGSGGCFVRRRFKTFSAFESKDYATFGGTALSSATSVLLLPPPPPPTPPKVGVASSPPPPSSAGESGGKNNYYYSSCSEEELRSHALDVSSAAAVFGYSNHSRSSSRSGSSNSLTVKEGVTDSCGVALTTTLVQNSGYTSSDSSSLENVDFTSRRSKPLSTRSLPTVFLSDSFQSSTSEHCHSYPANNAKCFPSDLLRRKAKSKRRRKKKSSTGSCRSLHHHHNHSLTDGINKRRHWSQADDRNNVMEDMKVMDEEANGKVEIDRAQILSSPVSDGLLANVEEQSTVSDQVWDGYQEPPYLSEAYSEPTVDEDAVRKLTEFGDDYGSIIGNSLRFPTEVSRRPLRVRRHSVKDSKIPSSVAVKKSNSLVDSDSDAEDLYDILEDTFKALQFARSAFMYKTNLGESDYAELLATCQTHLRCLRAIEEHIQTDTHKNHFTDTDLENLTVLIKEWAMLEEKIQGAQGNSVEGEILELRRKISAFAVTKKCVTEDILSHEDLRKKIDQFEVALASLASIKDVELIGVNLRVHRIIAESGCLKSPLKEDIAKLYLLWEQVYDQNTANLNVLHDLLSKYDDYQTRCNELSAKINNLNEDLDDENLLNDAEKTSSLRKELRELRRNVKRWFGREFFKTLKPQLLILERRLFPDCEDDDNDSGIVQHSDDEDKMAARSSPSEGADIVEDETFRDAVDSSSSKPRVETSDGSVSTDGLETEQTPPSKKESPIKKSPPSRLWRAFKASLPFQIAFALLCCLAYALEPHCCDFFNSFSFSLMPQLRHTSGPPPV